MSGLVRVRVRVRVRVSFRVRVGARDWLSNALRRNFGFSPSWECVCVRVCACVRACVRAYVCMCVLTTTSQGVGSRRAAARAVLSAPMRQRWSAKNYKKNTKREYN